MNLKKLSIEELKILYKETKINISRYNNTQLSKKVQLNSAYGACGSRFFRYYNIKAAEAITLSGQLAIKYIINNLNRFFNNILKTEDVDYVIASDTDSVILNMGPLIDLYMKDKSAKQKVEFLDKFFAAKVNPYIAECYEKMALALNCKENKLHMKREKICEVGIFGGKKRYALKVWANESTNYNHADVKITGYETQRSSTPVLCRKKMKETIELILDGDKDAVKKLIKEFKSDFVKHKKFSPTEIATPGTANNIRTYTNYEGNPKKGTPMHVFGSIVHNKLIDKLKLKNKIQKINESEKIRFIKLIEPNVLASHVFSFVDTLSEEFDVHRYIDYQAQFDKVYMKPVQGILDIIGWDIAPKKQHDLF